MGATTAEKLSHSKSGQVISWCPSCYVQFTETTLPAIERQRGARPFEMTPFMRFLDGRLAELKPHLRKPLQMRIALHRHAGLSGAVQAAIDILQAIPGIELIDLKQPAVGLQSTSLSALPAFKRELQLNELQAAGDAGVDALVTVYHSEHRELCAHERDWPFRIVNILELVGESMELHQEDRFKQLKIIQDADLIIAECSDMIAQHALDAGKAREVVVAMLGDQPLPLKRGPRPAELAPNP
jgi:heterodisulfide reductase subunit D